MRISIPCLSLVTLIGPSGSGKTTFARKHFLPTETLSSDYCRGLACDDENDQSATDDAFSILHFIAGRRLARGKLVALDATNVQPEGRKQIIELARQYHCLPVAIVFNLSKRICENRNRNRPDRQFGPHVVAQQQSQLRRSLKRLKAEGFRFVYVLNTPEEADSVVVERTPLWNDRRQEHGPFDIIGDVHGCCDELEELLETLGYHATGETGVDGMATYVHPAGRKAVFVGDLVDRGPRILDAVAVVRNMVAAGAAFCVPGNHDVKLLRYLHGRNVQITHGLDRTIAEIEAKGASPEDRLAYRRSLAEFIDALVSHYVFDDGRLVVAHAGLKQEMHGRGSAKVREFALFGETTGETDEFGSPVRQPWAVDYRGSAMVAYGHTPTPEAEWLNRTINVDTGCVFGGKLTALRYPEREIASVPARMVYCEPRRPFLPETTNAPKLSAQQRVDDILDAEDVLGKRLIRTRLRGNVAIQAENATAALETMSRFSVDPKWLIYLPPTMSPSETTATTGLLEHPTEAFTYYRNEGCPRVICEQKHMGSRAVVIVCRDRAAVRDRFGVMDDAIGVVFTRTGRRFFSDETLERDLLSRVQTALETSGFWEELGTSWVCLDCELMPWSTKARELLRTQYASTGAAGRAALPMVVAALEKAAARMVGDEIEKTAAMAAAFEARSSNVIKFVEAYRQYCWEVESLADLKLAPFHILATEGTTHADKDHLWHLDTIRKACEMDPSFLLATPFLTIDVTDADSQTRGVSWWRELTDSGGEGMVVKPLDYVFRGRKGLSQPALKCRGREYLRIIYGPDYDMDANLERLRSRRLGAKRSLALREFALGIEALERFVRREPLRRVHECAFGVLALECEPVDPRL